MFSSDIKTAFRNIFRNRIPSLISILGLSIGLGCIIILLALIIHEKSFDRFIPEYRSVYRITLGNNGLVPYPLPETMAEEFPAVKAFFRYYRALSVQIRTKDNVMIRETQMAFADTSIYRILGVRLLSGKPADLPGEIALSKDAAEKYFNDLSPLGMVLPVKMGEGFTSFIVSGVYENFPSNSTLQPSLIAETKMSGILLRTFQSSMGDFGNANKSIPDWTNSEFLGYVLLERNADPLKLAEAMEKYKEFLTMENKDELHYKLQPVSEVYFRSAGISGNQFLRQGNPQELIYYEGYIVNDPDYFPGKLRSAYTCRSIGQDT